MEMPDSRRLEVLRAIVEDYVRTREPVGSRAITQSYDLGVSPATVRNDMSQLEDEGYIAQTHTSSGRVPTDKGYRLFVDRLAQVKPLSAGERAAIERFLSESVDLDDVMSRAARLVSRLTGQVAAIQYPSLNRSSVRHLELVPVATDIVLLIVITEAGRVEQRTLHVDGPVDADRLRRLGRRVGEAVDGIRFADVSGALSQVADQLDASESASDAAVVRDVARVLETALQRDREDRIALAGTANLAHVELRFGPSLRAVLEALEEQVTLLRLFDEMATEASRNRGVTVRIGHENRAEGLSAASVVASPYGLDPDESLAVVGSIGPTRMDYPGTIAAVRAVARYLSRILAGS